MPPLQKAKPEHASRAEQVEVSLAMKPKQLNFVDGRAETPWGDYGIEGYRGSWWAWCLAVRFASYDHKSSAEAQAAAQADFERRARECFEENDND